MGGFIEFKDKSYVSNILLYNNKRSQKLTNKASVPFNENS